MTVRRETKTQKALDIHPKVVLGTLSGAITVIILYVLNTYAGVNPPAEVGASISVLVAFIAGWLAPKAPQE